MLWNRLAPAALCLTLASTGAFAQYKQTDLVSDGLAPGAFRDTNLKNPWGIALGPGPMWIADQMTGLATVYDSTGSPDPSIVVTIPAAPTSGTEKGPTGQVFNSTGDFAVGGAPALFIFSSLDGGIIAWGPSSGSAASLMSDQSKRASYTGLALGSSGASNFLYAANNTGGTVDVFDKDFKLTTLAGSFTDPTLPTGLLPFNVQNVGGQLYVTYAPPDSAVSPPIKGAVDIFNPDGTFVKRFATGGPLDGPWGVVKAPSDFGVFSDKLLIGNDGNGHLNAFDPTTGAFAGEFKDAAGNPIVNEELWGLTFGSTEFFRTNKLYFAAGINGEAGGLFGSIEPAATTAVPLPNMIFVAPIVMGMASLAMNKIRRRR